MWVFQNNKTAAILVSQNSPVGFELLSYHASLRSMAVLVGRAK